MLALVREADTVVRLGGDEAIAAAVGRADQAMYRAKAEGRNRVQLATQYL